MVPGPARSGRIESSPSEACILCLIPPLPHITSSSKTHLWLRLSSSVVVSLVSRPPTPVSSAAPMCFSLISNREHLLFSDEETSEAPSPSASCARSNTECGRGPLKAMDWLEGCGADAWVLLPLFLVARSDLACSQDFPPSSFMGGNSTKATSGINGAGTQAQQELGIPDSAKIFFEDTKRSVSPSERLLPHAT